MAQFQAYNRLLVSEKEGILNLRVGGLTLGYIIHSQYPSYRGTFLSCIEQMDVFVDGEKIPHEKICFAVNGKQFFIDEFKNLYKEYWFILDKAKILILQEGGLATGSTHKVKITMRHRIPYTGYSGEYMCLNGEDEKELTVAGEVDTL